MNNMVCTVHKWTIKKRFHNVGLSYKIMFYFLAYKWKGKWPVCLTRVYVCIVCMYVFMSMLMYFQKILSHILDMALPYG